MSTDQQTSIKGQPMFSLQKFLSVVTALYFASILLIVNRRIPFSSNVEFFVLFAMLLQTAAHAKIVDFLPKSSVVHESRRDSLAYAFVVVPVYGYMLLIELWAIYYLFTYDAETDPGLLSLRDNRFKILNIARAFSVLNVVLFVIVIVLPMLARIMKKRISHHHNHRK